MSALAWFGLGCAVFVAAALYDLAYGRYVQCAAQGRRLAAASWSVATAAVGLATTLGVLKASLWLVIPELAGLFVGTWIAVRPVIVSSR